MKLCDRFHPLFPIVEPRCARRSRKGCAWSPAYTMRADQGSVRRQQGTQGCAWSPAYTMRGPLTVAARSGCPSAGRAGNEANDRIENQQLPRSGLVLLVATFRAFLATSWSPSDNDWRGILLSGLSFVSRRRQVWLVRNPADGNAVLPDPCRQACPGAIRIDSGGYWLRLPGTSNALGSVRGHSSLATRHVALHCPHHWGSRRLMGFSTEIRVGSTN